VQAALERREPRVRDALRDLGLAEVDEHLDGSVEQADGFATPRPAMSGADPCTASNIAWRAPMFADPEMPTDPATCPAMSERMSP
jgi:hypothetical protein